MITANTRVKPIKPENQAKSVKKLDDGSLEVTQHSGNTFTISKDEPEMQAFVIYSMLNGGF